MLDKIEAIKERFLYLEGQLSDPTIISDISRYKKINKEYKDLKIIVAVGDQYHQLLGNIATSKEMLTENDPEMKELAQAELNELQPQLTEVEARLKTLLIPKNPEDAKDVIFEIRSGTGGDEASLFAGDLYRMYSKYFEHKGWKVEVLDINEGSVGGYNKLVLDISGEEVFGSLKFESGAHRVQRIPKTESQGRIHTSAATVAAMPKFEQEDVDINRADLKIDTYRSSGAGGQHVNKTESAVRITHLPSGIVAESQESRNQIKNREIALQRLYAKIYEIQKEQHESEVAAHRKSLVGSGDRSDKIRTYNYPQNRVTDHRLEGSAKNFNLQTIINGDLEPIIELLQLVENAKKLQAEEEV